MATEKFITKATAEKVAKKAKSYADSQVSNLNSQLKAVAKSGAAADVDLAAISGLEATKVQAAIAELLTKLGAQDITVEQAQTPGEGMTATTYIKKNGVTIGTINIPKDYVNNIVGIVTEDGEGNTGTFLKVNVAPIGDTPSYEYVDASGLVEYITSGSQSGDMVVLTIDPATHQATVSITDGTVTKDKLTIAVQTSLDKADSALQDSDVEDATDAEVNSWFGDSAGS